VNNHEHLRKRRVQVAFSLLITSDSRDKTGDKSGRLARDLLIKENHKIVAYKIVRNDHQAILMAVKEFLENEEVEVLITSGGTGISRRDVTVETISPIFDKKIDGFGELFRFLTYQQIHTGSIMSRATAGVARGKVIICLPGSLGAVSLSIEKIILPEIGHMVREAQR